MFTLKRICKMVDWQITATTILCDAVADEVTFLVKKDWTAECTGYAKHCSTEASALLKKRGKKLGKQLACEGPQCYRLVKYKEKLLAEEEGKESSGGESDSRGGSV